MRRIAIGFFIDRRAARKIGIDAGSGIVVHAFDAVLQANGIDAELAGKVFQSGPLGEVAVLKERFYILAARPRSEEHTSELQSLIRSSYAVFCAKKKYQSL